MPRIPLIAIVDDDEAVRIATESLIRSLGLLTRAFASAQEFLEADIVDITACLITDVQMPGLSGLDLYEVLLGRGLRMPIIFITAYPEERFLTRAQAVGAAEIFVKPFNGQSLAGRLMEVLREDGRS